LAEKSSLKLNGKLPKKQQIETVRFWAKYRN